jgi:hypothetical protein
MSKFLLTLLTSISLVNTAAFAMDEPPEEERSLISKSGDALLNEDAGNTRVKELQRQLRHLPEPKYLDCFPFFSPERVRVDFDNLGGYKLEDVGLEGVESIQTSFHDSRYSMDLREEDHQSIRIRKDQVLLPVKTNAEKIEFLELCVTRVIVFGHPIPHYNLIDYPNFLVWKLNPETFFTAVMRGSSSVPHYADFKVYYNFNKLSAQREQEIEIALQGLIHHLRRPQREPALLGYQLEVSMKDLFSKKLAEKLNLTCAKGKYCIGINVDLNAPYKRERTVTEVEGYRYYWDAKRD